MAKKDIFENLSSVIPTDSAYLLDPSVAPKVDPLPADSSNSNVSNDTNLIAIDKLVSFSEHPFTVNTNDDDFKELVQSIKDNGVISEILVRPAGDKFEIISGHRRVAACKEAGISEIPAHVKDLTDYQATVLMVHSNLYRDKISHSEKAKAYRMIRDAEKHQGIKGIDTAAVIGEGHDSKRQVYRYIRLSYLRDEILDLIDVGSIAFRAGVELGYLSESSQDNLIEFMNRTKYYPTLEDAEKLKKSFLEESELSFERIVALLSFAKKEKKDSGKSEERTEKPKNKISFKCKELEDYFIPGTDPDYMESVIRFLLKKYSDGEIEITDEEIGEVNKS